MDTINNRATRFSQPISFKDVTLYCVSCGEAFNFSPGEQIAYADRGWSEPRHCPIHRGHKHRQMHRQPHRQEQPYRPTNLDDVLARARREIARYRETEQC